MTNSDQSQQPVINFMDRPTKSDVIKAVRQLLVEQGFSVENHVKPEIEKIIKATVSESINKLLTHKRFEELIVTTALVSALSEQKHFDSNFGWQRRIKDLVTKALVDKLAADFTVQVTPKSAEANPPRQALLLTNDKLHNLVNELAQLNKEIPKLETSHLDALASGEKDKYQHTLSELSRAINKRNELQAAISDIVSEQLGPK